jgi:hypothetical protein
VTALPGDTPRLPVTTLGPVLVTVDPPRTAKLAAVPSVGAVARIELACPIPEFVAPTTTAPIAIAAIATRRIAILLVFILFSDGHVALQIAE